MAIWCRKALAAFPDLRQELNRRDYSLYDLFGDLRTLLWEAHDTRDIETLRQIYGFAEWCMSQRAKTLWNPAGVSFYEHIFDRRRLWEQVIPWLSPQVLHMVRGLWEVRLRPLDCRKFTNCSAPMNASAILVARDRTLNSGLSESDRRARPAPAATESLIE